MKYDAVIFDFDGTICDTGEGIVKSAKYALDAFGYKMPEDCRELEYFIGPPLMVTFQEKFGADPVQAGELVKKYRQRYSAEGLYESRLYDGIPQLLKSLCQDGIKIGIASSKPVQFVEALLEHFNIRSYFSAVCAVTFSADCESKASIIERCCKELGVAGNRTLMAGDRSFDINGAKANIIKSAGVLWGYGSKFELIEAGAEYLADKPGDIEAVALGFFEQTVDTHGEFSGNIITVHLDTVALCDGTQAKREVVDHPGGVAVVGLTENAEILLVRQFRYPYRETIYEIPAGKLEKGEDPLEAAKREFCEECGAYAREFTSLGELYPTPGYCGEIIHIYFAGGLTYGSQMLDDDEYLDVIRMPLDECVEKIISGEIKDAKTIAGILKLKIMLEKENRDI